jgi:hypothetical protein
LTFRVARSNAIEFCVTREIAKKGGVEVQTEILPDLQETLQSLPSGRKTIDEVFFL